MFSFFKCHRNNVVAPQWASFFSDAEYRDFIKAIDKFFYKKNISYKIEDDASIKVGPNDFGLNILGLTNVAQLCKQDERRNYYELISGHFDALIRTYLFDKDFNAIVDDYEAVEKYLATRLYPLGYLEYGGEENKIYSMIAGEIAKVLVFDLPNAIQTITPEQAEKWNKTYDELFEKGVENVRQKYPCSISREKIGEFEVLLAQGDHFFAPNIVFDLEKQSLVGNWGAIIGVPHRHAAIIYPLETLAVVNAVTSIIPIVDNMSKQGPGGVSNNLIWYKDGVFEQLRYKIENNNIEIYPSEKFLEVLNNMAE
ncbi:hypothetical protein DIU31_019955 [Mucilaginibacter rubeus]|uniref:Uncharacterized protein n=1 Tax=Mucilaginibacter rubeus TaxID=2027860 RepID=A0AAE6MJK8_9SPHI|nr:MULTISPECIES: hypothetical protein [Mucilaginibacter]QEM05676.1 hypothetical protein DIU31_019955 [Mucilaginibacter rubeus]QEM18264.1 hypothetical protein DIU38_020165 [Mucilaginibacter gossypii]QTE45203.1 hypothetical protein J3L19_07550 [Mucilaginibacter rubeus]QTE51799.1 hypothetical protein J3L21_07525 [Mucilaginibacter rubeus]QTE56886.1 hypothetical protein J3L23_32760 [Mucilaginibacter rubeus]